MATNDQALRRSIHDLITCNAEGGDMLQKRCAVSALWITLVCSFGQVACEAADTAGYRASLFNGRDLDGWQVSGCTPTVEDGLLVLGGPDGWLRTNEKHGD